MSERTRAELVERVARAIDANAWSDSAAEEACYPAAKRRLEWRRRLSLEIADIAIAIVVEACADIAARQAEDWHEAGGEVTSQAEVGYADAACTACAQINQAIRALAQPQEQHYAE